MIKKCLLMTLVLMLVFSFGGIIQADEVDIAYVSPSMESTYWGQYVEIGVRNATLDIADKHGIEVNYTTHGPAAEAETEEYINSLEAVIGRNPDIIVTGTLTPDATAPIVSQATARGIHVNFISLGVDLPEDQYGTLYYCAQPEQGALAAEAFYETLEEKGLPKDGIVGVHMSVVVPVLEEKIDKFRERLSELAPDLELLDTQYNDNVVERAIDLAEDQLSAYGDDLVGFFAGNNVTGVGISRAVADSGRSDELVNVAIDSDPEQIEALRAGFLDALVVQTPYDQAYEATMNAYEHVAGLRDESPKSVNISAVVVTPENMDDEGMQEFLDPTLLERE